MKVTIERWKERAFEAERIVRELTEQGERRERDYRLASDAVARSLRELMSKVRNDSDKLLCRNILAEIDKLNAA